MERQLVTVRLTEKELDMLHNIGSKIDEFRVARPQTYQNWYLNGKSNRGKRNQSNLIRLAIQLLFDETKRL